MASRRLVVAGGSGFLGSHYSTYLPINANCPSRIKNLQISSGQRLDSNISKVFTIHSQPVVSMLRIQSVRRTTMGHHHQQSRPTQLGKFGGMGQGGYAEAGNV